MKKFVYISIIYFLATTSVGAQVHPNLALTQAGLESIRTGESAPLFEAEIQAATQLLEGAMSQEIDVPIPKDMGGGYTHEKHKENYKLMHLAGALYQILGEEKYAAYVKEMLFAYENLYPTLPIHPTKRSYATGKLFWQCLNEANWLVYTSQAYDCIYAYLTQEEREKLEKNLFRPFADFISTENPRFFNRIHNHSTWANAAVGMIGLAMNDEELVEKALYGLPLQQGGERLKDDDGGFIYDKGKAGFLAQIDNAFSPDGYYTEGPYYQRYAMTPFMLFAQALHNGRPEMNIFAYRDSLLIKAVYALIHQTDASGEFFPINDAQKGMSIFAGSVVSAVNIAYGVTQGVQLAGIAKEQEKVSLDQNGYAIARQIQKGNREGFDRKSVLLRDGKDGTEGALAILWAKGQKEDISVVFKATAQGLGHGHYDKLSFSMFEGETEVLQDYGAARWVNIDQKAGGRYLKENNTWAKQSVAHNTMVIDEISHFGGTYDRASKHHSDMLQFDSSFEDVQWVSAKESNAYPGTEMRRTLILWKEKYFPQPVLIDLVVAFSNEPHQYDLPYHYAGQILKTDVAYEIRQSKVLGEEHGYQHIYQEALGQVNKDVFSFNWIKDNKFYTRTSWADSSDQLIMARIGANDPNFNLRRDALFIHRKSKAKDPLFLSVLEAHGSYDPVTEIPSDPFGHVKKMGLLHHDKNYTVFSVSTMDKSWLFRLAHEPGKDTKHQLTIDNTVHTWTGNLDISQ